MTTKVSASTHSPTLPGYELQFGSGDPVENYMYIHVYTCTRNTHAHHASRQMYTMYVHVLKK